ncbi:MAG: hypothetical protein SOU50_06495 [Oscillospiraceae bacterium]|nr:hypothetical protein [Oscillospiraceae bacterium]
MPIKGTTRRVIEVHGTDSCFFEKAVLYVRPECFQIEDTSLAREARRYTAMLSDSAEEVRREYRRERILKTLLRVTIGLAAAAVILGIYAFSL